MARQKQGKRKKFGAIEAITSSRRLPSKKPKGPVKGSPESRANAFYKVFSKDIQKAVNIMVPAGRRGKVKQVKEFYGAPELWCHTPQEAETIHDRLIRSRLSDKVFAHKLNDLLRDSDKLLDKMSQTILTKDGIRSIDYSKDRKGEGERAYRLLYSPFFRQLLKEIEPMRKEFKLDAPANEILGGILRIEEGRRMKMKKEFTVAEAGDDRIYIHTTGPNTRTTMHEVGHNVLRQSWRSETKMPAWKNELFAHMFADTFLHRVRLSSEQRKFFFFTPRGRISRKEYADEVAYRKMPKYIEHRIKKLKEITQELKSRSMDPGVVRSIREVETHISAFEVMRDVMEKNNYDIEKAAKEIKKIVYDKKIKTPEDVKV